MWPTRKKIVYQSVLLQMLILGLGLMVSLLMEYIPGCIAFTVLIVVIFINNFHKTKLPEEAIVTKILCKKIAKIHFYNFFGIYPPIKEEHREFSKEIVRRVIPSLKGTHMEKDAWWLVHLYDLDK